MKSKQRMKQWLSFCLMTLLYLSILPKAHSRNWYCLAGGSRTWKLAQDAKHIEKQIVPRTDGVKMSTAASSCEWKIMASNTNGSLVVLSGLDDDSQAKYLTIRYDREDSTKHESADYMMLNYSVNSETKNLNCLTNLKSRLHIIKSNYFKVFPLSKGDTLTVSFRQSAKSTSNLGTTPTLRIQLMKPGFCSRDKTYFDDSCYTTSIIKRSLNEELASLDENDGILKLASFSSIHVLRSFIKQSQTKRVGTGLSTSSKVPLNLTQRLRIGLFYQRRTKKIFYLNTSGSACNMLEFAGFINFNSQGINSSISCGSLTAAHLSNDEKISFKVSFTDCSEALPTLISFPDKATSQCPDCSRAVLSWIKEAENDRNEETNSESIVSPSSIWKILLPLSLLCIFFGLLLFLFLYIPCKRRRAKRRLQQVRNEHVEV